MTAIPDVGAAPGVRSGDDIVMAWCGPTDHGVTMFGRELYDSAVRAGFGGTMLAATGPGELTAALDRIPAHTRLVHLQANDWLFADGALSARERLLELASRLRNRGIALSVTLHDLPHTEVSPELYRRRVDTFAAVASVAAGVVVASRHEARLLATAVREAGPSATSPAVAVIPLPVAIGVRTTAAPVATGAHGRARPPADRTVGVFGFVYPGKGHAEVLDALAHLDPPVSVLAIGRASTGHEDLLVALTDRARANGMRFDSTGFVADDEVGGLLRSVAVPVAPAAQVSASGSLNSWIAAGRRPLVLAGDYTREFADRHPGCVQLYAPGELRARVSAALAEPASTWLPAGTVVDAGADVTAQRYLEWLRALADRC